MKNVLLSSFLLFITIHLSGCSIIMSASGKDDPYLGVLKKGTYKGDVELQLGKPKAVMTVDDNMSKHIYKYKTGVGSSNGRAAIYLILDLFSGFLWEIIGTPVELVKGKSHEIHITYNKNDKVVSYQSVK